MSKLIDNIKRLAGMVKNETKSGGNTAVRVGGLFEEIATELENKYDKTETDQLMSRHNAADNAHLNIQERIDTALGDLNRNKLDKTGNGSNVTVHFNEAAERRNVSSGDTLSVILGKVQKWFAGLQAVAFSGKAADVREDATHRFLTDMERTKLNGIETGANKYTHPAVHPATMITDDAAHRFVSDTEKNTWNGKAAGSHTHPATQVTEDATHRFLTDAERAKLNGIETGANKYTHPATHPATLIVQDTTHRFVTDTEKNGWNSKAAENHTHNYAAASHTHPATQVTEDATHRFVSDTDKTNWNSKAAGSHHHNETYAPVVHAHTADQISDTATKVMMTASERSKLAGIEDGANNYIHPNNSSTRHVTDAEKTIWNNSSPVVSKSPNGYIKIGGIIIQWGAISYQLGQLSSQTIYFPTAFPTKCASIVLSSTGPHIDAVYEYTILENYLNRFKVMELHWGDDALGSSRTLFFQAIGY